MPAYNIFFSAALFFAGFLCLLVAAAAWQLRGESRVAVPLLLLLGGQAWWDLTYALFWAGTPGPTPLFWLDITYLGAVTVPTAFLLVGIRFTTPVLRSLWFERWTRMPHVLLLALEPALITLFLWTDPWHGLFFAGQRDPTSAVIRDAGPLFWSNAAYSYLIVLAAFVLLVLAYRRYQGLFRRQAGFLLAAATIPWVSSLAFVAGLTPLPGADHTPFAFTLSSLLVGYAVWRYRLLDVVPIARHVLIEKMSDGVVVLDSHNRVVDINPAAGEVLSIDNDTILGGPMEQIFARWPYLLRDFSDLPEAHTVITTPSIDFPGKTLYLDLHITPLYDKRSRYAGRLIVWRDITALKLAQDELQRLAITDSLTMIYNRRHFYELAQLEVERSLRYHHELALIMIDVDLFKNLNDRYGHQTGDSVLFEFTRTCQELIRLNDVFARLGGEEFVLLLPETGPDQAYQAAERLRQAVENCAYRVGEETITITISLGVANLQDSSDALDMLIQRADQAMYRAKNAGRNQTSGSDRLDGAQGTALL